MTTIIRRDAAAVLAARKKGLAAAVTARRQQIEGGTAIVGGIPVWIDAESQGKLTGAALGASLDPAVTIHWKGSDGTFYTLTGPQVVALAQGAMAYVQAAFAREGDLLAQIAAASDLAALQSIDIAAGWPGEEA